MLINIKLYFIYQQFVGIDNLLLLSQVVSTSYFYLSGTGVTNLFEKQGMAFLSFKEKYVLFSENHNKLKKRNLKNFANANFFMLIEKENLSLYVRVLEDIKNFKEYGFDNIIKECIYNELGKDMEYLLPKVKEKLLEKED